MKSSPLLLLALIATACDNPSGLSNGKSSEPGAMPAEKMSDERVDKMEHELDKITSILEKEPAKIQNFNNERISRMEARLDKVIGILEQAMPPQEPDPDVMYSVPIQPVDPSEGPADAKVTIVEGFEFLCPYCYMVNPTVEKVVEKYPKDVRIVSKYLIIHGQPAIVPGLAACAAAKQGKYTALKASIWSHFFKMEGNRPSMQQDQVSPENIEKLASEAGVDVAKMKEDMAGCQAWIQGSQELLHNLGASATPAFFINGRFISGAQPFENFDKIIQEELAKADKKIADGVAQNDYYSKEVVAKGTKKVKGRFDD